MKVGGWPKVEAGAAVQRVVELSRGGGASRYGDYIFDFCVANDALKSVFGAVVKNIIWLRSPSVVKRSHIKRKTTGFLIIEHTNPVPFFDGFKTRIILTASMRAALSPLRYALEVRRLETWAPCSPGTAWQMLFLRDEADFFDKAAFRWVLWHGPDSRVF